MRRYLVLTLIILASLVAAHTVAVAVYHVAGMVGFAPNNWCWYFWE